MMRKYIIYDIFMLSVKLNIIIPPTPSPIY